MADIDPGRAAQFPQTVLAASDAPALPRRAQALASRSRSDWQVRCREAVDVHSWPELERRSGINRPTLLPSFPGNQGI